MATRPRRTAASTTATKSFDKTPSTTTTTTTTNTSADKRGRTTTATAIMDLQSPRAQAFFGTTFIIGLGLLQLFFLPELVGEYKDEHHRFLLWERMTHYTYSFALSALLIHYYQSSNHSYRMPFRLHAWGYWLLLLLCQHLVQQVLHEIFQWTTSTQETGHHVSHQEESVTVLKMMRLKTVNLIMDSLGLGVFVGYVLYFMKGSYQRLIMGRFVAEPILVFGTLLNLFLQTHMRFIRSWYHYFISTESAEEDNLQWIHHEYAGLVAVPRHQQDDMIVQDKNSALLWLLFRVIISLPFWCFYLLFFLGYRKHHSARASELKLLHSNTAAVVTPEELDDFL